jgi:uncharacterized protein YllA (UPF0747 family)
MADSLRERVKALEAAGVGATVHVREAAPLSFFHPDGPEGPRYRLEPSAGGFMDVGGTRTHTLAALLAALDSRPASFSTSALLRPILQDTWLPTAAYVGGPAEVAYFAQLAPLYSAFELSPPLVVPRARLRLLESPTRRLLADKALGKTRGTVARAVGKLAGNYEKARLHRDAALIEDVRRLQWWLFPEGQPQERYYGISYFAAHHGERAFLHRVLAAAEPLEIAPRDVDL